jgi:DeoR family fructose operon transcriptional repressor
MRGMAFMYAEERQQKILELINTKNKVSVKELCELFNASPGTIRNDLTTLERMDLLDRTHGGAISIVKSGFERRTLDKVVKHKEEKVSIGRTAAALVEDGDVIAVDTSTTTLEMVRFLKHKEDLTIVTNDIVIASLLEDYPNVMVMLIGGIIRKGYNCSLGPQTISALSEIRVDKTFLACNGVSVKHGVTTPNADMAQFKRKIIEIASEVILVCDSSKINRTCFMQIAPIADINLLITDKHILKKDLDDFQLAGLAVSVAEEI